MFIIILCIILLYLCVERRHLRASRRDRDAFYFFIFFLLFLSPGVPICNIIYTFVHTKDWCNRIFILYILYPRGTLTVNGATDDNICKFCRKKICYIINNKYFVLLLIQLYVFRLLCVCVFSFNFFFFFNLNGFRSICFYKSVLCPYYTRISVDANVI